MNWLRVGTAVLRAVRSGVVATLEHSQTFTGLKTFDLGTDAPFAVENTSAAVVANLDADKVDGQHASAFATSGHTHANAVNVSGTPAAGRVASWVDADTIEDAGFAASDVARLGTAQVFTAAKTFPNTGLKLLDTDASHGLILAPGSILTADRTLTVTTGDANRTLTLTGNATLNQDVSSAGTPTFTGLVASATSQPIIRLNDQRSALADTNVLGELQWYTNDASTGGTGVASAITSVAVGGWTASVGASSLLFWTMTSSTLAERMRIDNNGNVGISTTSPTAKLHLPASTTTRASLRIPSGSAPTSPNSGDLWYDGTNLKFRDGSTTRTLTWT